MAQKLFVLTSDNGDGSRGTHYTMNEDWIKEMKAKYDRDELDEMYAIGCDGDGFHYDTLTIPDGLTLQDLGIRWDCSK